MEMDYFLQKMCWDTKTFITKAYIRHALLCAIHLLHYMVTESQKGIWDHPQRVILFLCFDKQRKWYSFYSEMWNRLWESWRISCIVWIFQMNFSTSAPRKSVKSDMDDYRITLLILSGVKSSFQFIRFNLRSSMITCSTAPESNQYELWKGVIAYPRLCLVQDIHFQGSLGVSTSRNQNHLSSNLCQL